MANEKNKENMCSNYNKLRKKKKIKKKKSVLFVVKHQKKLH